MRRGGGRTALVAAVVLGAALRLYPIGRPHLGIELQEHYPRNAVVAIGRGDWEPFALHHGAGLLDVLRALYGVAYSAGRLHGAFRDRIDLVAAYARDSLPFVVVGRIVVAGFAIATLVMVGRLAAARDGGAAGAAAALILAVSPIHVRESLHVWPEILVAALAIATAAAAVRTIELGTTRDAVVLGLLGGMTLATKFSAVPVLVPVALGVLLGSGQRSRRIAATGAAGTVVFLLLSPYLVLKWRETLGFLSLQAHIMSLPVTGGLSPRALVGLGLGWGPVALAGVGLAVAARTRPRDAVVFAAFPIVYVALLARSSTLYARYLAVLAPFVALFAGAGAARLGARFLPRRPALACAALALAVAVAPLAQSVGMIRLFAREDTRQQAGDWIMTHVPPGTAVTLPDAVPYPNPVLPLDRVRLQLDYPWFAAALAARGSADPARTYAQSYLRFFDTPTPAAEHLAPIVVTASHPVVVHGMNVAPDVLERLHAAGARAVATFTGVDDPLPAGVVFDPVDAEYVPLAGADHIRRPGPNITIWDLSTTP